MIEAYQKRMPFMKNLDPEQHRRRELAHAAGALSDASLWPNWPPRIEPRKARKAFRPKTPRFVLARAHRAGHGRYS